MNEADRREGEDGRRDGEIGRTGQDMTERNRQKSYSEVVIEGIMKKARMFVGDSIPMKTDKALNKGGDVLFSFTRSNIKDIAERGQQFLGLGKGGAILVQESTNNAEMEGSTAKAKKYRPLVRTMLHGFRFVLYICLS